jgi:hypothetical protein
LLCGNDHPAFPRLFTSAFTLPPATLAVTDFDIVV